VAVRDRKRQGSRRSSGDGEEDRSAAAVVAMVTPPRTSIYGAQALSCSLAVKSEMDGPDTPPCV
jgi:hypothetical protein